jgi:glucose-1-phosphate thymidylyltransferase
MKGIILAGGTGSRLFPVTRVITKHLLPVYDKPLIYYPLSVLMLAGIREILIISTEKDLQRFKDLFDDGSAFGLSISYAVQDRPKGIGEAFIVGEDFIGKDNVSLILGDNIFYGQGFSDMLALAALRKNGATIFAYYVKNPENFGIIEFDQNFQVMSLEEKPEVPKSNYAATGLYFYDNDVIRIAKKIRPSPRGELEITDINKIYLQKKRLHVDLLGRGFAWIDTGTHESILEASHFVRTIEKRQGLKIACIEEIAYKKGYIGREQVLKLAESLSSSGYGDYLGKILQEKDGGSFYG